MQTQSTRHLIAQLRRAATARCVPLRDARFVVLHPMHGLVGAYRSRREALLVRHDTARSYVVPALGFHAARARDARAARAARAAHPFS
jgi:hypothetical protein